MTPDPMSKLKHFKTAALFKDRFMLYNIHMAYLSCKSVIWHILQGLY